MDATDTQTETLQPLTLSAERTSLGNDRRAVLRVDGPVLPVTGFAEITDMYKGASPC